MAVVSLTKISASEPANYRISRDYFHSRLKPRDRRIIGDVTDRTSDLLAIAEAKIAPLQAASGARDRFNKVEALLSGFGRQAAEGEQPVTGTEAGA